MTGMKKSELLKKLLTMQAIHDLEYMNWVMMETLRMQPPTLTTTSIHLTQDAKVGDLYLKKGDEVSVNLNALSFNAK